VYNSSHNPNYGYKALSTGNGNISSAGFSYPGYPSYLGVDIFKMDGNEMPRSVLGFTNGRQIAVRRGLKGLLAEFVLLHEEEHVKDMSAGEKETDRRALRRLLAKRPALGDNDLKSVKKLLRKRWQHLGDFGLEKHFSYKTGQSKEVKKKIFEKPGLNWYGEEYF